MITSELAEAEWARFCDLCDLLIPDDLNEEERKMFAKIKRTVIRALEKGDLVIDDEGTPEYSPPVTKLDKPIRIPLPTSGVLINMDRKGKNEDVGKLFAVTSHITGVPETTLGKLKINEFGVVSGFVTLFLALL